MSRTEEGIQALAGKLAGIGDPVPTPSRNDDMIVRLEAQGSGLAAFVNLWDGAQINRDETLGADVMDDGFEIQHEARIEFAVAGGEAADREAKYDAILEAIFDGLMEDRTLGGVVSRIDLGNIAGAGSGLVTDGMTDAKGAVVPVVLTFVSSRPF